MSEQLDAVITEEVLNAVGIRVWLIIELSAVIGNNYISSFITKEGQDFSCSENKNDLRSTTGFLVLKYQFPKRQV